jgi:quercetin dioxygenase-like cupin family protein
MSEVNKAPAHHTGLPAKAIKVSKGATRMHEKVVLDGTTPIDFKVLSQDTDGNLSVMISSNNLKDTGPAVHIHPDFDETFYITEGEVKFKTGDEFHSLKEGDSIFIPRNIPHAFTVTSDKAASFLIICQPAGKIESFFQGYAQEEKVSPELAVRLMTENNMIVVGPPLGK